MRSSTTSWNQDQRLVHRGFLVLSNTRIAVRPNLPGLDLSQVAIEYAFSNPLAFKQDQAVAARKISVPEWLMLGVTSPDAELVGVRRGISKYKSAQSTAQQRPALPLPGPLAAPRT